MCDDCSIQWFHPLLHHLETADSNNYRRSVLAKAIYQSRYGNTTPYIGTEPWKPKEALEEYGIITDKADIFAFGLTLWEMMTLSIPHINLPDDDDDEDKTFDESDFDDDAYYAALGTRPPVNMEELDETYQKVIELFSVCTNEDPKDRPSAACIVEALEVDIL
ncbi:lymphokine-activated killer T-cell-originated protein kinase-like [Bos javanicus]|uniref:lymphokine-activated killer T-cell-originated protein kinase-like n=1 Tax=Bos javanicus TaxID=9906 RepID=UPI002AA6EE6B|nr:lymphokine-activated killer T-cell-originated protein kinase-like [Bos javanicus]